MAACPRDIDEWIELAKNCKYLTENDLKVTLDILKYSSAISSIRQPPLTLVCHHLCRNYATMCATCSSKNLTSSLCQHQSLSAEISTVR